MDGVDGQETGSRRGALPELRIEDGRDGRDVLMSISELGGKR